MLSIATTPDIQTAREQISNPARTVFVARSMVPPDILRAYMQEAESQFEHAPRTKEKPALDAGPDRVMPWVWDHHREAFTVHRLYRFIHNESGTLNGDVHQMIMDTRDQIESAWPNRELYRAKSYRNIHIIAKYEHNSDGYARHTDVPFEYPHPLLQCWLQLTEPGTDFVGGDLILYPPGGGSIAAIADLGIRAGDVLFFDKRTEHEVTPCGHAEHGRGRWIAIVGAMAPMQTQAGD